MVEEENKLLNLVFLPLCAVAQVHLCTHIDKQMKKK